MLEVMRMCGKVFECVVKCSSTKSISWRSGKLWDIFDSFLYIASHWRKWIFDYSITYVKGEEAKDSYVPTTILTEVHSAVEFTRCPCNWNRLAKVIVI